MTKAASLLAGCTLARGRAGGCAWCGADLPPRRRNWCSDRCSTVFWANHSFSRARVAAKRRDKYRCLRCAHVPPKRPTRASVPGDRAYRAAMRAWRASRAENRLEVNHIVPALGAHGVLSCVHHLENLESLCVPCHKGETAATRPRKPVTEAAFSTSEATVRGTSRGVAKRAVVREGRLE